MKSVLPLGERLVGSLSAENAAFEKKGRPVAGSPEQISRFVACLPKRFIVREA
jgi:hypothetical protein